MPDPVPEKKEDLNAEVTRLVESMSGAVGAMAAAAEKMSAPPPPAGQPQMTVEQVKAKFDEMFNDPAKGGPSGALEWYTNIVAGPLAAQAAEKAAGHVASAQKAIALKDPEVAPLMKRFSKEIEAEAKRRGNSYLADNGYEGIAREIAAKDSTYQAERDAALQAGAVEKAKAEWEKANPRANPAPSQEGVHSGAPITQPAPAANEEAALAAIPVSAEELEVGREVFGMDEKAVRVAKKERADWTKALGGVLGVKKAGGIPICSMEDLGFKK